MIRLTEKEELIMRSIWKIKLPFSIKDLSTPYPYTTVASIVKKLQMKGYVHGKTPTIASNKNLYDVVISKDDYILNNLKNLFSDFCDYNPHIFMELATKILSKEDE